MWSDPEVETVAPGVHRAPVPMPHDGLKAINVYVIEDGDGITLVDAGFDGEGSREAVEAGLAVAGAGLGDVRRMLITHFHHDHLGQATALRRAGAGGYLMGEGEKPNLAHITTDPNASFATRMDALERHGAVDLAAAGRERGSRLSEPVDWDQPMAWLGDGEDVEVAGQPLTAVATPGHTRGHLCFHNAGRRILFAGDHVLPHITPSIGFETETDAMALGNFLASLAKVAVLDVDLVLPAHGAVFTDLGRRVDELVAHHDVRLAACVDAIAETGSHARTVAGRLGWTRREKAFDVLDGFNQVLAVWETAAHLELLAARGRLRRHVAEDGAITFHHPA